MNIGFYAKLALSNMKKNRRFFVPRILSEAGLLGCFYIMMTLAGDTRLAHVTGGEYLPTFMSMGVAILTILDVILMFYTNSFLMKQRKREFGLYNILGMEKRHVGRVLLYEALLTSVTAMAIGIFGGMLFYKICSLIICKLLMVDIVAGFYYIIPMTLIRPIAFFTVIDVLAYFINRISIAKMKPVDLLKSKSAGEKEPKVKWPLLVIGLATLIAGYYISITTKQPLQAILMFFLAVVLVMAGTYCLFVTGSIFVLKCLKKNEKFYYSAKHMPAVSGLLYRMKQNAVGLASIAILATGVLTMISTTVSLYAGMNGTLDENYPQHYLLNRTWFVDNNKTGEEKVCEFPEGMLEGLIEENAKKHDLVIRSMEENSFLNVDYLYQDGTLISDRKELDLVTEMEDLTDITWITEAEYERSLNCPPLNLKEDEIAVAMINVNAPPQVEELRLEDRIFKIKEVLTTFPVRSRMASTMRCYGIVVADDSVMDWVYKEQYKSFGAAASEYTERIAVTFADKGAAFASGEAFDEGIRTAVKRYLESQTYAEDEEYRYYGSDSIWNARGSLYGMYGTMLFLGILLGMVFIFATAMIIYYKQISEGYEDRDRFQIMKKIGMSEREIKKTINRQILMVFYLPLLVAGVHMCFAFPILERLLHILLLSSTWLFVGCSVIVFVLFAIVYVLIYKATARTYYKIVR